MELSTYLLMITLNVNWLNATIKNTMYQNGYKKKTNKNDSSISWLKETRFRPKDTCRRNVKQLRNTCHGNGHQKSKSTNTHTAQMRHEKKDFGEGKMAEE